MKTIMCFGTFDNLHQGHWSYLKQARNYGDYLIVIVARDKNVKKIKGRLPKENEKLRLQKVKELNIVNKVILGRIQDRYAVIKKYQPDVICLGYDQEVNPAQLKKVFNGRIVRLKPYQESIYKSSKLARG